MTPIRTLGIQHRAPPDNAQADPLTWGMIFAILVLLFFQTGIPESGTQWQSETGNIYNSSSSFIEKTSWSELSDTGYSAGDLWISVLIRTLALNAYDFGEFLTVLMLLNVFLIVLHFLFFKKYGHPYSTLIFAAVLMAFGPALLYGKELLMSFLVLWGWQFFRENRIHYAAVVLGLATSITAYPLIILPLLFLEQLRRKNYNALPVTALYYAMGLLFPIVLFKISGGTLGHALYGLLADPVDLVLKLFVTAALLGIIEYKRQAKGFADVGLPFLLLLTIAFFMRQSKPEYYWWSLSLLPFVPLQWLSTKMRWFMLSAIVVALVWAQVSPALLCTRLILFLCVLLPMIWRLYFPLLSRKAGLLRK